MEFSGKKMILAAAVAAALGAASSAHAAVIAGWTFETSAPTNSGPINPETGTGVASGFHTGASVYSSPAGNGSAHSYSSNTWAVNDYYQFTTSTIGFNAITLQFDQTSSNTGPRNFTLRYSTNGSTFTNFATYSVLANAAPNPTWSPTGGGSVYTSSYDLSSVTALNGSSAVYFRLTDNSTTSANGGTVATAGTDRVDNFIINGTTVGGSSIPEPASLGLLAVGALSLVARRRRA